jgi:hypothetical protein
LIRVHDVFLLCEIAMSPYSFRAVPIISKSPFVLAIMVTRPAAVWSKLLSEQKPRWRCLRATRTSQKGAALWRAREVEVRSSRFSKLRTSNLELWIAPRSVALADFFSILLV